MRWRPERWAVAVAAREALLSLGLDPLRVEVALDYLMGKDAPSSRGGGPVCFSTLHRVTAHGRADPDSPRPDVLAVMAPFEDVRFHRVTFDGSDRLRLRVTVAQATRGGIHSRLLDLLARLQRQAPRGCLLEVEDRRDRGCGG